MIDKHMKKIIPILGTILVLLNSCSSEEQVENIHDKDYILSWNTFNLLPAEQYVEFYLKTYNDVFIDWSEDSKIERKTLKLYTREDHGVTRYTAIVGPNLSDTIQELVLEISNEHDVIEDTITILQEGVKIEVDSENLVWDNDLESRTITFKANYEYEAKLEPENNNFVITNCDSKLSIKPNKANLSNTDYRGVLKIVPKNTTSVFINKYTHKFELIQYKLFEVDKTELLFNTNEPKTLDVIVTYNGDWNIDYDNNLFDIVRNRNRLHISLNMNNEYLNDIQTEILVIAEDGNRTLPIKVSIVANMQK